MHHKEIAERLRKARGKRNLTVSALSKMAGISKTRIADYENGSVKDPSVVQLAILAVELDVPKAWLCFGSGMNDSNINVEMKQIFERCIALPNNEKRFLLESMKRILKLNDVVKAIGTDSFVVEDYSMS